LSRLVHIFRPGKVEYVPPPPPPPAPVIEEVAQVIQPPPPRRPDPVKIPFIIGGGPFHTNMLSVEGLLSPNYDPNTLKVQWYRADVQNEYYPIPGATVPQYWPTADDLHANLRVDFSEGQVNQTRQIEVDPDCLTIDPLISRAVERNVENNEATFLVQQRKYDGTLEDREITFTPTEVIVKKGTTVKVRVRYHRSLFINLSPWEQNVFDIEFNDASRNRPVFVCKDIHERDVIALTGRSFINTTNKNTGQIELHRVEGLTQMRTQDRLDYRHYEMAMLSV